MKTKIYEQWLTDPDTGARVPPGSSREAELLDTINKAKGVQHIRRTLNENGLALTHDETGRLISVDFCGMHRTSYAENMPMTTEGQAIQRLLLSVLGLEASNKALVTFSEDLHGELMEAEQKIERMTQPMRPPHTYRSAVDIVPPSPASMEMVKVLFDNVFGTDEGVRDEKAQNITATEQAIIERQREDALNGALTMLTEARQKAARALLGFEFNRAWDRQCILSGATGEPLPSPFDVLNEVMAEAAE